MGAGDLSELVKSFWKAQLRKNSCDLRKQPQGGTEVEKEFCKQPRVQILGFTTQMSLYLKACDVLLQSRAV